MTACNAFPRLMAERGQLVAALRTLLDLCPRMSDDDPIAPALADECRNVRALLRSLGEVE